MSGSQPPQQAQLIFREIKLRLEDVLGAGAYGKVCKATCDGLPCAAKIIHSTLFDLNDKGSATLMRRFDEECDLLSKVRHPNIVLYLATYRDPVTKLPVLLMELCEQSLTKHLERSPNTQLAFHVQVNIAHDVALALVYLHANEVIHRDLTSNNVLLNPGLRAKVTDFGMSKLANVNPRMTPLTMCPGNNLYMSPEALSEPPTYTKKLDVFSLGVLVIQILTRLFPDPTARFRVMDVSQDPKFSGCRTVNVPVAETERRSNHLSLISEGNPLKNLALTCINDAENLRSTSQVVCRLLQDLKQTRHYVDSVKLWEEDGPGDNKESTSNRARINSLRLQVQELRQRGIRLEESHQSALNEMEDKVHQMQTQLKEKEGELEELRPLRADLRQLQEVATEDQQMEKKLRSLIDAKDREINNCHRKIGELEETISALQISNLNLQAPSHRGDAVPFNREPQVTLPPYNRSVSSGPQVTIQHMRSIATPCSVKRGSAAMFQSTAFITPEGSNKVYQITHGVDRWNVLPDHVFRSFGVAIFDDGFITTVGGWTGQRYTNKLMTLNHERRWVEKYPPMYTPRIEASVVYTQRVLVAAGGFNGQMLDVVEVLTLYSMQWGLASRLPHPFYMGSAIVCGNQIYLTGGYSAPDVKSRSLLTCSVSDLLNSLPTSSLGMRGGVYPAWRVAGQLPYDKCSITVQGGDCLLAVGGKGDSGEARKGIHVYDPRANFWKHVSDMSVPRSQCFAFSFPDGVLYAVGGEPMNLSTEVMKVNVM